MKKKHFSPGKKYLQIQINSLKLGKFYIFHFDQNKQFFHQQDYETILQFDLIIENLY